MAAEFNILQSLDHPERLPEEVEKRSLVSGKGITRVWKNNTGKAGELMIRRTKGTGPGELCITLLDPNAPDFTLHVMSIAISVQGLSQERLIDGCDFGRVRDPDGESNLISFFATPKSWGDMSAVWHRIINANTIWDRIIQADSMEIYQEDQNQEDQNPA